MHERIAGAWFAASARMTSLRERLWRAGSDAIGDTELLSIVLGKSAIAAELVRMHGDVAAMSRSTPRELAQTGGVGVANAARLAAAFELGRRAVAMQQQRVLIGGPEDIYQCLAPRLAGVAQEVFFVVGVDIRNGLLDVVEVARGTAYGVEVHPREVFRPLVRMAAAAGVLAHNHPSGDATPSSEDVELTRRLREAGQLLGIPIIDHVVIGDATFRSVAEWVGTEL
jgi:DNA repair protein RadC